MHLIGFTIEKNNYFFLFLFSFINTYSRTVLTLYWHSVFTSSINLKQMPHVM